MFFWYSLFFLNMGTYCYSGLRKKLDIQPPSLPELEISPKKLKVASFEDILFFITIFTLVYFFHHCFESCCSEFIYEALKIKITFTVDSLELA